MKKKLFAQAAVASALLTTAAAANAASVTWEFIGLHDFAYALPGCESMEVVLTFGSWPNSSGKMEKGAFFISLLSDFDFFYGNKDPNHISALGVEGFQYQEGILSGNIDIRFFFFDADGALIDTSGMYDRTMMDDGFGNLTVTCNYVPEPASAALALAGAAALLLRRRRG